MLQVKGDSSRWFVVERFGTVRVFNNDPARPWAADVAVTVCRDDACPATPGVRQVHWGFDDPWGRPIDDVRVIRDGMLQAVEGLVAELR